MHIYIYKYIYIYIYTSIYRQYLMGKPVGLDWKFYQKMSERLPPHVQWGPKNWDPNEPNCGSVIL